MDDLEHWPMTMRGWVSYECHTCQGTGEVDYRAYATGMMTAEANLRGSIGWRSIPCRDCDGTGKRWRPA